MTVFVILAIFALINQSRCHFNTSPFFNAYNSYHCLQYPTLCRYSPQPAIIVVDCAQCCPEKNKVPSIPLYTDATTKTTTTPKTTKTTTTATMTPTTEATTETTPSETTVIKPDPN